MLPARPSLGVRGVRLFGLNGAVYGWPRRPLVRRRV
jgi:hypothetical protein